MDIVVVDDHHLIRSGLISALAETDFNVVAEASTVGEGLAVINKFHPDIALVDINLGTSSGLDLHQFEWTHEGNIGELPLEWNWLAGEYQYKKDVKNIHYTEGGPWFDGYRDCEYSDDWKKEVINLFSA